MASEKEEPFLKFIIRVYCIQCTLQSKIMVMEREMANDKGAEEEYSQKHNTPNKIKRLKELASIRNVRNVHQNRRDNKISMEDLDEYKNVINTIYWIRNNLFHGDKKYSFERDQELVEIGYEVLLDINDGLIGEKSREKDGFV